VVTNYSQFYSKHLKRPKWGGHDEGSARCPFHNDCKASLSVNRETGLWFCHACNVGGTAREFAKRIGVEAPADDRRSAENVYDYRDEKGALLYQVVRFAGKKFRQRRPDAKARWLWNLEGVRRVPYRLPELLEAKGNVFVVEGEKDVETLRAQGLAATCNSGGAGRWREEYGEYLKDRVCIVLPDNDDPGRAHAREVAEKLRPFAAEVLAVELPDLPPKGDVSDWLAQGHTAGELLALVERAERAGAGEAETSAASSVQKRWPTLNVSALHGIAGEFVRMVEPRSEADPAAVLSQFLAVFGSYVGGGPHFEVEGAEHPARINVVIVGETGRGRKRTAWNLVAKLLREVDPDFARNNMASGLSSGEGLIWRVRDAIIERRRTKGGKDITPRYEENEADPGVVDKRLIVLEEEYAQVLAVIERPGNTLSVVVRGAWDRGDLSSLTKNSPARATGAHISIVGHITAEELERRLSTTEAGNGFANRFLFICARRSKTLPRGGAIDIPALARLAARLRAMVERARKISRLDFDEDADRLWSNIYPALSEGRPGLLGAVTGRAEAYVVRLAVAYALLDADATIRAVHLRAALALWQYAEDSARYLFGGRLGDPDAELILEALRNKPGGLTRTQIRDLFDRHAPTTRIERALEVLAAQNLAVRSAVATTGRAAEVWRLRLATNTTEATEGGI